MKRKLAAVLILALAAMAAIPRPPLREGLSFSQAVLDREGRLLRLSLSSDGKYRLWVPLEAMSPKLIETTLLQEDRHFRRHPGFNPVSLLRAAWRTYVRRSRRIGGSTITMQLARIRYRLRTRRIPGKLRQIVKAVQLERHYTKDQLLEAYLNLAPYGGNVEGAGAASLIYYGKDASRLTLSEAVTLSVVPQDPSARAPRAGRAQDGELARASRALWVRWARDKEQDAEPPPLPAEPDGSPLPFHAPHFVEAVLKDDVRRTDSIRTTLDLGLQALLERQVGGHIEAHKRLGITNAAAILLDHGSMEVLAAAGSADYSDVSIQGQVNGIRALRSPGSALKPFVYGLGMDQGIVHPLSVLKDAPRSFGGFNPENFDGDFTGPIRVRDALIRSRNVPAVEVAAKLEGPNFYEFLRQAGVPLPKGKEHYGLAPVLGGAEVTMEHMARLYAMLANRGELNPLRARLDQSARGGRRLLSPEACFMILEILKDVPRPGRGFKTEWTADALPVHWKTGTSHGFRDAWSAGVFGQFVLVVWVGNFDGEGNPELVGIKAAAPLFFGIADALKPKTEDRWLIAHDKLGSLTEVKVCATSGKLPKKTCTRTVKTWFIPGKSPIRKCDVHRAFLVDRRTGQKVCGLRRPGDDTELKVFEVWPSDLLKIFQRAGLPRRPLPVDGESCGPEERAAMGLAPRITSPDGSTVYSIQVPEVGKQEVPLTATVDADVRAVFWFADDRLLGKAKADKPFFWRPRPGKVIVRVVDDHGRSDSRGVEFEVLR